MKPLVVAPVLLAALALAACGSGQSKQDKAQSQVCSARADISKQLNTLKGLKLTPSSAAQVQTSLTAIDNDLKQIANAQGSLNAQRKTEVKQATQAFTAQIKSIAGSLASATSLSQAESQATAALKQLASAYEQTFAKVSCS